MCLCVYVWLCYHDNSVLILTKLVHSVCVSLSAFFIVALVTVANSWLFVRLSVVNKTVYVLNKNLLVFCLSPSVL